MGYYYNNAAQNGPTYKGDVEVTSVVDSATDVLSLAEAKVFLGVSSNKTGQDALITSQITAAVEVAEKYLSRDILSKERSQFIRYVDVNKIELYNAPIASVDSVTVDDVAQIIDDGYELEGVSDNPYIILNQTGAEKVVVTYTTAGLVDNPIVKQGVYSVVQDLFNDGKITMNYKSILASEKLLFV